MSYESKIVFKKTLEKRSIETLGFPEWFDIDVYLDAVEHMIVADEVLFAFKMLENPPAYFRENPTERMIKIRNELNRRIFAQDSQEIEEILDVPTLLTDTRYYPRLSIVTNIVKELNSRGIRPNIYEFSPGNYSIMLYMDHLGLDFGYKGHTLNRIKEQSTQLVLNKHRLGNGPAMFCCFEVVEHLFSPKEYVENWARATGVDFDYVVMSTPYGTCFGGMAEWTKREIGHIRTFTGNEFLGLVSSIFPGLQWVHVKADMQVAVGMKEMFNFHIDRLQTPEPT
jgi:hypothetical protein